KPKLTSVLASSRIPTNQPMHSLTTRLLLKTLAVLSLSPVALCGGDQLYTVNSLDAQIRRVNPVTFSTISAVSMPAAGFPVKWANGLATNPLTGELFVLLTVGLGTGTDPARRLGKV